ncbi:unnamed protein product [Pleuronectes platessa]|uniref:Uncharacterized protein n=1 Tax=Pleuronectes platessa TaxID=8262 RepID=A0A9N7Z6P2_PLEPL|nr:unnamed protein product [Pleuronectes platessa]
MAAAGTDPEALILTLSIKQGANLCDSVATECLPAAERSTLRQPSPPPAPLRAASLRVPTDWLPSSSAPPPPSPPFGPPGQEQLFQNWPTLFSFSPAPPTASEAEPVCRSEGTGNIGENQAARRVRGGGGVVPLPPSPPVEARRLGLAWGSCIREVSFWTSNLKVAPANI